MQALYVRSGRAPPVDVQQKLHIRIVVPVAHASKAVLDVHGSLAHVASPIDKMLVAIKQG